MAEYRYLNANEIIREGDEYDAAYGWNDPVNWQPVRHRVGAPAPDPKYPAHTIFRRKLDTHQLESEAADE